LLSFGLIERRDLRNSGQARFGFKYSNLVT